MRKNIAVITGGAASEVGIALKSAGVVVKYLRKAEYNVYKILIDGTDWWYVEDDQKITLIDKNDFTLTLNDHKLHFDAVFIAIHGTPAEDGKLQGYFDLLNMPYNTCGVFQAALTFDKQRTKEYLSLFGIKSAKAIVLRDAAAIEAAGQQNADTCYGCHGGRQWYRISYKYPRHPWPGMPTDLPDWAKGRPTESDARFLPTAK